MVHYVDSVPETDDHEPVILVYWGIRGGGARYTYEIARAFVELADRKVIVSLNAHNELFPLFQQLGSERVHINMQTFSGPASILKRAKAWFGIVPNPWSFGRWCRKHGGPNVRVIITMGNPLSFPMALALRAARVPFTHVVHDATPHPGESSNLMVISIRWASRLAQSVVALSENVRTQIISEWHLSPTKVSVVPHGPFYAAEAAKATRDLDRASGSELQVLFLGRIVAYKGIGLLLDAWSVVSSKNSTAHLTIAGDGDLAPYAEKIASAQQLTIDNRWLSDADIIDHITNADILVLPYLEASQSGVIGIAHSFGVPVVCTDVGGLAQQVDPTNGDIVVQPKANEIAEAIRTVSTFQTHGPTKRQTSWQDIASIFAGTG